MYNFGIGEPSGNVAPFVETLPQFGPGNIQNAVGGLDLVVRHVAVFSLEVDHHIEGNHGHADVGLVFLE